MLTLRQMTATLLLLAIAAQTHADEPAPLQLMETIPLKGGTGRLDHFALDPDHDRLFVSNRSNNSLDIVDLKARKLVKQILDQAKIRGIAYVPALDRIFVGNGDPGVCNIFDGKTYELIKSLPIPHADNVQFDSRRNLIFVGHDGLTVIDPDSLLVKANIPLPGTTKAFRIDPESSRLYVNTMATQVCVIDTEKLDVVSQYPIVSAAGNTSLALDPLNRRLFIGCRKEPKLIVLDADNGEEITNLTIPSQVDDLSFDAKRNRIYASSGEGLVAVIQQTDANHYSLVAKIPTNKQAQTSIFDPRKGRLYVGSPQQVAKDGPVVLVYQARP